MTDENSNFSDQKNLLEHQKCENASDAQQAEPNLSMPEKANFEENVETSKGLETKNGENQDGDKNFDSQENAAKKESEPKKSLKKLFSRWFIDAFTGMAQGLFCTLIAGTILSQIASWFGDNSFAHTLDFISKIAKMLMGAGIGVGIAHKLGAKPLVIFSAAVTGLVGAFAGGLFNSLIDGAAFIIAFGVPGNPIGSYAVALFTVEIASLYAGRTKLDIVLVPLGMMLLCLAGIFLAWPFIKFVDLIAVALKLAIEAGSAVKIIVGIFVAVVMGVLLTMPTSSAAIWIAIATSETAIANPDIFSVAGGAAVAGCAAHMIGFAVASFRENKWSGLISQGIGTSMLQIPNIMKKPRIMLPEIVASVFSGLVAVLLGLRCNAAGGGMGTSGLVGVFGVIDASSGVIDNWKIVIGIIFCLFVIPAAVSFAVSEIMRNKKFINFGDQQL